MSGDFDELEVDKVNDSEIYLRFSVKNGDLEIRNREMFTQEEFDLYITYLTVILPAWLSKDTGFEIKDNSPNLDPTKF